jgi:hypothetical protein
MTRFKVNDRVRYTAQAARGMMNLRNQHNAVIPWDARVGTIAKVSSLSSTGSTSCGMGARPWIKSKTGSWSLSRAKPERRTATKWQPARDLGVRVITRIAPGLHRSTCCVPVQPPVGDAVKPSFRSKIIIPATVAGLASTVMSGVRAADAISVGAVSSLPRRPLPRPK